MYLFFNKKRNIGIIIIHIYTMLKWGICEKYQSRDKNFTRSRSWNLTCPLTVFFANTPPQHGMSVYKPMLIKLKVHVKDSQYQIYFLLLWIFLKICPIWPIIGPFSFEQIGNSIPESLVKIGSVVREKKLFKEKFKTGGTTEGQLSLTWCNVLFG